MIHDMIHLHFQSKVETLNYILLENVHNKNVLADKVLTGRNITRESLVILVGVLRPARFSEKFSSTDTLKSS